MATSGKIQPGDEVEAYNGDGGLVLSVDCYGQDVIVHHTGMYPKVWAARELKVVRRGVFDVRELGAAEQNPVGWSVDEWNGLRWAYQARGWWAQSVSQGHTELGDWKRSGSGWTRDGNEGGAHVADHSEPGVFRALVCGTLLGGRFTCPDAAREAADAYLVSQGRLDKSRAFVRLGEWEPAPECGKGYMMRRQASGATPLTMTARGEEGRASSDARAVANGWLDPSRAFKATGATGPAPKVTDWLCTPNTATRIPPQTYNGEPKWAADVAANVKAQHVATLSAVTAKPTWGEWERIAGTRVLYSRKCLTGGRDCYAEGDFWSSAKPGVAADGGDATDIDDAREKADAFLVARGELEAGRAFKRVGDWTERCGGYTESARAWANDWKATILGSFGWVVWGREPGGDALARGPETGDAGKAAADAELVRRGLLAESRAFKVDSRPLMTAERTIGLASGQALDAMGLPREPGETDEALRARWHALLFRPVWHVPSSLTAQRTITLGPGEAITVTLPITSHTTVTLAQWEQCLPHLLSSAPREFRDGFNRRQGEAWEAYLRGLAWVKEAIQCKRVGVPNAHEAVTMAALTAQGYLGPEWVKANVR